jgi:hypothetical protein
MIYNYYKKFCDFFDIKEWAVKGLAAADPGCVIGVARQFSNYFLRDLKRLVF